MATSASLLPEFDMEMSNARKTRVHEAVAVAEGGTEIMKLPKMAALRDFVMNHVIHHRAQLGAYLAAERCTVVGAVWSIGGRARILVKELLPATRYRLRRLHLQIDVITAETAPQYLGASFDSGERSPFLLGDLQA